jgi:hypothetical protein
VQPNPVKPGAEASQRRPVGAIQRHERLVGARFVIVCWQIADAEFAAKARATPTTSGCACRVTRNAWAGWA